MTSLQDVLVTFDVKVVQLFDMFDQLLRTIRTVSVFGRKMVMNVHGTDILLCLIALDVNVFLSGVTGNFRVRVLMYFKLH